MSDNINQGEPKMNPMSYGQTGYEAYAKSTGGRTYDGRDMPKWEDLPANVKQAWHDAAEAISGTVHAAYVDVAERTA